PQARRQGAGEFVFRNANGLAHAAQCIFGDDVLAILAQDQTDGRRVGIVAELVIDDAQVEIHLAGVFGLELAGLQVDDNEAAQFQVVEQQVDVKVGITDVQVKLPADKREALPQLQQKPLQVVEEIGFQLPLVEGFFEGQEIEDVG